MFDDNYSYIARVAYSDGVKAGTDYTRKQHLDILDCLIVAWEHVEQAKQALEEARERISDPR